ncbi:MAG: TylF/MycF/NovP-related O-methyltransferase [Alphaproteobacteria bacterium]
MLSRLSERVAMARLSPLARGVRQANLTYLSPAKLAALEEALDDVERDEVPGDYLEFGVALGGSAILIAARLDDVRSFHGYDVFGMIPPPGDRDDARSHERYADIKEGRSQGIGGQTYYGYIEDLYARVCESFRAYGLRPGEGRIMLHRGLFEETLDPGERAPVALAHIDCDWHQPVAFCLAAIRHRLSPGARVVLDDYNDYGGCRRAVDTFLEAHPDIQITRTSPNAVLVVKKGMHG